MSETKCTRCDNAYPALLAKYDKLLKAAAVLLGENKRLTAALQSAMLGGDAVDVLAALVPKNGGT